jgi:hypothetical protein
MTMRSRVVMDTLSLRASGTGMSDMQDGALSGTAAADLGLMCSPQWPRHISAHLRYWSVRT